MVDYDYQINAQTHIKAEAYYQYLYDGPVENESGSAYSLLNESDTYGSIPLINDGSIPLINDGSGRDFGVELTQERFSPMVLPQPFAWNSPKQRQYYSGIETGRQ